MSAKLSDVFSVAELQLVQIAIAKASAGCSVFFNAEEDGSIASLSGSVGRRVSLCCFNQELSLLCGRVAFEQGKVAGAHISDTHKCRCGAYYYWVGLPLQAAHGGFCQLRSADALNRGSIHLVASYLRTLTSIGNIRIARNEVASAAQNNFVSLDANHLYGHPQFPSLIRMISEAGRSLLHAGRCLYFSYDSSDQTLSAEFGSDLSQEQVYSMHISLQEFPIAQQALEALGYVAGDRDSVPLKLTTRLKPIVGDGRFVVMPLWVVEHVEMAPAQQLGVIVTSDSPACRAERGAGRSAVLGAALDLSEAGGFSDFEGDLGLSAVILATHRFPIHAQPQQVLKQFLWCYAT